MKKWHYFPDIQMHAERKVAMDKLERIRELHSPVVPPKGMVLMGSTKGTLYCAGCDCGDPYLAIEWPCETREICDEETD